MIVGLPPLVEALYLASWHTFRREMQGQSRLLLRPHGSGGRVSAERWLVGDCVWRVLSAKPMYWTLTRAQAAQAVYRC